MDLKLNLKAKLWLFLPRTQKVGEGSKAIRSSHGVSSDFPPQVDFGVLLAMRRLNRVPPPRQKGQFPGGATSIRRTAFAGMRWLLTSVLLNRPTASVVLTNSCAGVRPTRLVLLGAPHNGCGPKLYKKQMRHAICEIPCSKHTVNTSQFYSIFWR